MLIINVFDLLIKSIEKQAYVKSEKRDDSVVYLTLDIKIYFQFVSFYEGVMKRTLWFGAHKKISDFNATLVCSLKIIIILYKLIDTVEARSKEMQRNITSSVPAQHDALESNFIAKKKIRESSKYYNSQIKSVAAIISS